jgi:hypothetical protein
MISTQVESNSKEEEEEEEEDKVRGTSPDQLTTTSEGEVSSEQLPPPKQETTRATSPDARVTFPDARVNSPDANVSLPDARVTPLEDNRTTSPATTEQNSRPSSVLSLRTSSQPLLHSKHYKQYERTSTPNRYTSYISARFWY